MLHYSIRPAVKALPPLAGPVVERDVPIAAEGDEALLGAIDFVEAGEVRGWACCRGAPGDPVQVSRLCPCGSRLSAMFLGVDLPMRSRFFIVLYVACYCGAPGDPVQV